MGERDKEFGFTCKYNLITLHNKVAYSSRPSFIMQTHLMQGETEVGLQL